MSDLGALLRVAYPEALATLARVTGSLDQAEDLLQEATARALEHWPGHGVPENPAAWLVRTARNLAIDAHRRTALARRHVETAGDPQATPPFNGATDEVGLRDDMLRLVFTCCHPALARDAQVALTLKAVAGLGIDEIARAFLVAPRTIEQRITRAKRRIREAGLPYAVPAHGELPERLGSVLAVVHLIFNEGHAASIDAPLIRHELCRTAIGQGHLLLRLFPAEPEVEGLLALMLLTHARVPARVGPEGLPIPLDEQDRTLWDRAEIREGLALVESALYRRRPGVYQVQAALSAVHARAERFEHTDWHEIVRLYDALESLAPSPVVALNRAAALSQRDGPEAGLAAVDALAEAPGLVDRHPFHAVRARLLAQLGRLDEARAAYWTAARLTPNSAEAAYLEGRLAEILEISPSAVGNRARSSSVG